MRDAAPIFQFNAARAAIVDEVVSRTTSRIKDPLGVLGDAIYNEVRRLSASRGESADLARFRNLARRVPTMSEDELGHEVKKLAEEHAWDVAGNFDPRVYGVATRLMPPVLGALIAPFTTATSFRRARRLSFR